MRRPILLLLTLGAAGVVGCTESTGPPRTGAPTALPHLLPWKDGGLRGVNVRHYGDGSALHPTLGASFAVTGTAGASVVSTSFWAVRGIDRSVQIDYSTASESGRFIGLSVPAGALAALPDGTPIAVGDSVLITAELDLTSLLVEFRPSGLTFAPDTPAVLEMWYTGATADLDGNGEVDSGDAYIEHDLLGIWYRTDPGTPWVVVGADHVVSTQQFTLRLAHFSGYAVSY